MRATAIESLRRDIQDGLNSGPATAWDPDEIKQAGRNRRALRKSSDTQQCYSYAGGKGNSLEKSSYSKNYKRTECDTSPHIESKQEQKGLSPPRRQAQALRAIRKNRGSFRCARTTFF